MNLEVTLRISEQLLDWVLESGEYDQIQLADLAYFVKEDTGTDEDLIGRTVEATILLMQDGVLTPGDMVDHEFRPWTVDLQQAERRIREGAAHVRQETGRFLPGDICWFRARSYDA